MANAWECRRLICSRSGLEARSPRKPYTGAGLVTWTSKFLDKNIYAYNNTYANYEKLKEE